jgi:N-acetyl sugar amidotransferase
MDESLAPLQFDEDGRCSCCKEAEVLLLQSKLDVDPEHDLLSSFAAKLKKSRKSEQYDCMVGLSGGVDSAYLAHVLHADYGLRLLAVHIDGGWNTEPAVRNIEKVVRALNLDLHTVVIEWSEMRDLQLSFLRAGVLNQDMPQDHAFFASLYRIASQLNITTFASGVNLATESVGQRNAGYPSIDGRHLRKIHQRHGLRPLKTFPIITYPQYLYQTRVLRTPQIVCPLNWINYDKAQAISVLEKLYGWQDYGAKHSESRFTSFYQDIFLPRKLGFDKRRLHLSSLIVSGQITREAALEDLKKPIISPACERKTFRFIAKKLGLSATELEYLVDTPLSSHYSYPGHVQLIDTIARIKSLFARR